MNPSASKGNRPEQWQQFLDFLDERLQLGLLDHLKRVTSYHFEEQILFIEPANEKDYTYLSQGAPFQQLKLLAEDCLKITEVKIKEPGEEE